MDELKHFFEFNLFSSDQIYSSNNINLQDYFNTIGMNIILISHRYL